MNRIEHQKIINLLDDATTKPSKFRPKKWVDINDDSWEIYRKTAKSNSRLQS